MKHYHSFNEIKTKQNKVGALAFRAQRRSRMDNYIRRSSTWGITQHYKMFSHCWGSTPII